MDLLYCFGAVFLIVKRYSFGLCRRRYTKVSGVIAHCTARGERSKFRPSHKVKKVMSQPTEYDVIGRYDI